MESNEDSIKILEMRIRQQMGYSLQKNMKPENLKYYMPSAVQPKPDIRQEIHMENAQFVHSAADAVKPGIPVVGDVGREGQIQTGIGSGIPIQAGSGSLPLSEEYIDQVIGPPPMMEYEHIEIPEPKEVQHARAMSGYERSHSLERKEIFNMEGKHFLDSKG